VHIEDTSGDLSLNLSSKTIAFISLMGTLGNLLFVISNYLGQIVPGVSIDLSHIPTFIASLYGGPLLGFLTGMLVGILPGIQYGPLSPHGSWLTIMLLPIGKSLTGLTAGLICKALRVNRSDYRSLIIVPLVLASYIPECLYTIFYFTALLPLLVGGGAANILAFVLPKAWVEIFLMSIFMAALKGNKGFNSFVATLISDSSEVRKSKMMLPRGE
jgi:riboflavin transporter FmnP